jgi:hypothetical protein
VKHILGFIENLPGVFEEMINKASSLQNALNDRMNTGSTDAFATRIWSTCARMLRINGMKEKDNDTSFIVNDSPLPLSSVLECVQNSNQQMLIVSVAEKKYGNFGELYAHFLVEGHSLTTHYVSMSKEFPTNKDIYTAIVTVSLRCNKSVNKTKIVVLVDIVSTNINGTDPVSNNKSGILIGLFKVIC